jgi:hypothetical protein
MRRFARTHALVGAALVLALALRVPWLDSTPNPSGDEGNWTWIARNLHAGLPAALPPDARFVPMTFARLIAAAYGALGVSFASARAVLVVGLVAGLLAAYALARRLDAPRAAVAVAFTLALHPWSVAWSRTVTVPYALSLALAVAGPLAWLDATRTRSPWRMLLAAQLLGAGLHFSPLAILPIAACALHSFGTERPRGWSLAAAATSLAHVAPMVVAAATAARGNPGRPRHFFTELPRRLYVFGRAVLGSLDGEATLRHFTGTQLSLVPELLLAGATVALLAVALAPPASAPSPSRALARMARFQLAAALLGLPLLLAPARPWNLPAIDAERYGFIVVAPFALALGALAERVNTARHLAAVALVVTALLPTARGVWFFARGGSPDRGFYTLAGGGGYRGWKVAREHVALPTLIRGEVERARGARPATLVVADYAFHPLHFVNAAGGSPTVDLMKFPLPERPGELHVFLRWSDGLFAPGFTPRDWIDGNERLTALLHSATFVGQRRLRVFVQPDGSPLCELWVATRVSR